MLMAGHQDAGQDGMRVGTGSGTVATIGLAGDHGGAQHALGLVVGSFQCIDI